jgi:DNA invertase Pin-like site-specific DNA recombinase
MRGTRPATRTIVGSTAVYTRDSEPTSTYVRISEDRQDGAGVRDQFEDTTRLCQQNGWPIAASFEDNDISASKYARTKRPGYRALLAQVREGKIRRIVVAHIDRLYRQPRELEELIDLADEGRIEIVSVYSGPIDLSTSDGRAMARIQIAIAAKASEDTSRRVLRAKQRNREAGLHNGGSRAFGWRKVTVTELDGTQHETWDPMTPDPFEADLIRMATDDVIAGASLTSIANGWIAAGIAQVHSGSGEENEDGPEPRWTTITIKRILTSPRQAGLMPRHLYEKDEEGRTRLRVVPDGKASWPAIVERAKWERCREILEQREASAAHARRRSLLTGILICGICGAVMYAACHSTPNPDGSPRRVWRCSGHPGKVGQDGKRSCGKVSITAGLLEDSLTAATFDAVASSDLGQLVKARAESDRKAAAIMSDIADIDQRIRETEAAYLRPGGTPRARYEREMSALETAKADLEGQYSGLGHTSFLFRYAGRPGALKAAWEDDKLSLEEKNAAIREALGRVAVMPATRRGRAAWDTDRLVSTANGFVPLRMRQLADAG